MKVAFLRSDTSLVNTLSKYRPYFLPLCVVSILVLASYLRLWKLGSLMDGFHSDEVMNGYVGRYILETGRDLYGNPWPLLYFDHFGDFPNVIPMYISGLGSWLLGSSVLAVRLPIALTGILTVVGVYGVNRWIWKSPWVAIMAAFLLAVLPWHVVLSRATAEGVIASCVFLYSAFAMMRGIEKRSVPVQVSAALGFAFCYFLYPGFRIIVPLVLLPTPFLTRSRTTRIVLAVVVFCAFLLTAGIGRTAWGQGRFAQTSFLAPNPHIETRTIQYSTAIGDGHILEARGFYNRYFLTARELVRQYASYFSPNFLTAEGGRPPRYIVPEMGLVYWTPVAILVLLAFLQFITPLSSSQVRQAFYKDRAKYFLWLLWIMLIAPIPAALTYNDVPNTHRASLLGVMLPFFLAPAWYFLSQMRVPYKKVMLFLAGALLFGEVIVFWQIYLRIFPRMSSLARQDEQLRLATWLKDHASEYQKVFVPGNEVMPLYYLFAQDRYPVGLAGKFSDGISIANIDNVYFTNTHCPASERTFASEATQAGVLIVERSECEYVPGFLEVGGVNRLDITKAYDFITPQMP